MSVTLSEHDGRPMVRIERRLAHPPEKVWRSITEPNELRHWFPAGVAYEQYVGAPMAFTFEDGAAPPMTGEVVDFDPPRTFAFLWEGELIRIELQPEGPGGCLLIFTHHFDDRPGAASFATGWTFCLDAMERALAGHPGDAPGGWEGMHELHEAYVAAFGLDQGTIEETSGGWQVRFERQLTRPKDEIWETLTRADGEAGAPRIGGAPSRSFTAAHASAGRIVAVEAPTLLEYEWQVDGQPNGLVRWRFSDGQGGAARLTLTQAGLSENAAEQAAALSSWQAHIERLAAQQGSEHVVQSAS